MLILNAEKRDLRGKKIKVLRNKGVLPAVVYGKGEKATSIAVPLKDFEKVWKEAGESTLIELSLAGKKETVLIYDVAIDPRKNIPIHADFYKVQMDKAIQANVPLAFIGESPAVKNLGGILVKTIHEVEVESLPKDLPREIVVDVSRLNAFGDQIVINDLPCPRGVKILVEGGEIVALVEEPVKEEELKAEEEKPKLEEIEVVGRKEKKEEETAESEVKKGEERPKKEEK